VQSHEKQQNKCLGRGYAGLVEGYYALDRNLAKRTKQLVYGEFNCFNSKEMVKNEEEEEALVRWWW
jgi:hypothetical protein